MATIRVLDVMTRYPITIKPSTNLFECAKKMVRKRVGSLLIVDGKKLVGFISERDVLWALIKKSKKGLKEVRAVDISPKKISTIKPDATIPETLKKMNKTKFDKLPVVMQGDLVGIVTIKDILNFHPEYYPEVEEYRKIREERNKLKRIRKAKEENRTVEGVCEECGNSDSLYEVKGVLICESCKNSI